MVLEINNNLIVFSSSKVRLLYAYIYSEVHTHTHTHPHTHTYTIFSEYSNEYSEKVHSFLTANNFNILTKDPTEKFHNLIHKTMQKK